MDSVEEAEGDDVIMMATLAVRVEPDDIIWNPAKDPNQDFRNLVSFPTCIIEERNHCSMECSQGQVILS